MREWLWLCLVVMVRVIVVMSVKSGYERVNLRVGGNGDVDDD